MREKLKVLIVASEVTPYAKSGGLGDVIGSLPAALYDKDIDVRVVFPKYSSVKDELIENIEFMGDTTIKLGWRNQSASIYQGAGLVPIYIIQNDYYFNRDGFYGFGDDFERFVFFTKASIEMLPIIDFKPDIIHFNDWQTALGPLYLKDFYSKFTFYSKIKSIFTIHNIQYQGVFGSSVLDNIGLNKGYNRLDKLEYYGNINFMKAGIIYADAISTVSKTYAKEIQMGQYGYGLDKLLQTRNDIIFGIVNGIDVNLNDPKTDKYLYKNFDLNTIYIKKENKTNLQKQLNLPVREDVPVISIISRLVDQKGFDLISSAIYELMLCDIQIVVLGTGDGKYENMFKYLAKEFPDKVSTNIFFSEDLAHKIYASSDLFLMPSLFEPCGLGQIFAMRYGTIPIVRNTGGLSDTVTHFDETTKQGNGFAFNDYDKNGMLWAINEAINCYKSDSFSQLIKNAMSCDFSWNASADKYVKMYETVLNEVAENKI